MTSAEPVCFRKRKSAGSQAPAHMLVFISPTSSLTTRHEHRDDVRHKIDFFGSYWHTLAIQTHS